MILSRFWYVVLSLALGAAAFLLFLSAQMYNRAHRGATAEALLADANVVEWYLKDDARKRASALIPVVLHADVRAGLSKATQEAKPSREARDKVRQALRKLAEEVPAELKFDAMWAVDASGRVIAGDVKAGLDQGGEEWDLGGYALVADALHGWIRDDAWVWKGRIYRVVARPVEQDMNGEPIGAVVGARIVDDGFARAVMKRTGVAVGFFVERVRVASGAPDGFDASHLDAITQDLKALEDNKEYAEKGRSDVRELGNIRAVYTRLPGEARDVGGGFAVGRLAVAVESPFDFFTRADNTDKKSVPTVPLVLVVLGLAAAGLVMSYFEHTRPMSTFRDEVGRLATGSIDMLQPSRFRGAYKKIAADVNDGIEKVVVKGGGPRRAADLEQVLGPLPAQPQMSAFAVPGDLGAPPSSMGAPRPSGPRSGPGGLPEPQSRGPSPLAAVERFDASSSGGPTAPGAPPPSPSRPKPPPPAPAAAAPAGPPSEIMAISAVGPMPAEGDAAGALSPEDELAEWRRIYEEFLAVKKQCGEPTASLTFEKFRGTLQRNKDALVQRHNCARVKFTVYVKEGKAALKASPVK